MLPVLWEYFWYLGHECIAGLIWWERTLTSTPLILFGMNCNRKSGSLDKYPQCYAAFVVITVLTLYFVSFSETMYGIFKACFSPWIYAGYLCIYVVNRCSLVRRAACSPTPSTIRNILVGQKNWTKAYEEESCSSLFFSTLWVQQTQTYSTYFHTRIFRSCSDHCIKKVSRRFHVCSACVTIYLCFICLLCVHVFCFLIVTEGFSLWRCVHLSKSN